MSPQIKAYLERQDARNLARDLAAAHQQQVPRCPHVLPRRVWRYPVRGSTFEQLRDLSPRQLYLIEQSTRRWEARHGNGEKVTVMLGEAGTLDGFRIIRSSLKEAE